MPRPKNELPQNVPDHMKLMLDLIVLAFQMDKTRIATLMLNNDLSQMNFKFVEGVQGALHLDLTHNGRAADKEAMYLKTNQFHIAQFAYLTAADEGHLGGRRHAARQLDPDVRSSLFDGDRHGADQLPILLTGKGGGTLKTGRILDYLDKGDEQPQGLQPAPVADGPHGRQARSLRRRDHAARGALTVELSSASVFLGAEKAKRDVCASPTTQLSCPGGPSGM